MPKRLTDGLGPHLRPYRLWVSTELAYPRSVETLLLMQALCLAEDGAAFWEYGTPKVMHWCHDTVQVGVN